MQIPAYTPPDFSRPDLASSPAVRTAPAPADGVAPSGFHATSNHPEYLHLGNGVWLLARESRMDGVMVLRGEELEVVEPRRLRAGDPVVVGRSERGEEGIYLHTGGFASPDRPGDRFAFRTREGRETPFSRSYDDLYGLLRHERDNGRILWVAGPATVFDRDSREAFRMLIEEGYCHALLAGNALATHDLEAALYGTALGQEIYDRRLAPGGHCNHLDAINEVRRVGSIAGSVTELGIRDGVVRACVRANIPLVLAGSIRDDGPLPGVITDSVFAQEEMRRHAREATTVIALATQLHAIAVGNMTPGYRVMPDGTVRPVFFYVVDTAEFAAEKLTNRGSVQVEAILTNVQDFLVNLRRGLVGR